MVSQELILLHQRACEGNLVATERLIEELLVLSLKSYQTAASKYPDYRLYALKWIAKWTSVTGKDIVQEVYNKRFFWTPGNSANPLDWRSRSLPLFTQTEVGRYLPALCSILNKPLWWEKYNDPSISSKWKSEIVTPEVIENTQNVAVEAENAHETSNQDLEGVDEEGSEENTTQPVVQRNPVKLNEEEFNFLLEELDYLAKEKLIKVDQHQDPSLPPSEHLGIITPVTAHGVYISDNIIPQSLGEELGRLAKDLEDYALSEEQWHPGSKVVLDLVHPSNYCAVNHRTTFSLVPNSVAGLYPLQWPPPKNGTGSSTTQWIPTDILVKNDGEVEFESYINNLSQRENLHLYTAIAAVLRRAIPMFERSLHSFEVDPVRRISPDDGLSMKDFYLWQGQEYLRFKYGNSPPPDMVERAQNIEDEYECRLAIEEEDDFWQFTTSRLDIDKYPGAKLPSRFTPLKEELITKVDYGDPRPICRYDGHCFRKNPQHFEEFIHKKQASVPVNTPQVNTPQVDAVAQNKPVCMYDGSCYQKNPVHLEYFAHPIQYPNQSNTTRPLPAGLSKPECQYGDSCLRKNPQHFIEYRHPRDNLVASNVAPSLADSSHVDNTSTTGPDVKNDGEMETSDDNESDESEFIPGSLRGKRLQVIVKMATILLTPENPKYDGGRWHLEGLENEAIAATAIYYYDMDNISRSVLRFRHFFDEENDYISDYPQSRFTHLEAFYGIRNESIPVQSLGFVEARKGRMVSFPNFQQHCVEPFSLEDPTRPGYRRILAFFLIHPEIYIPSTRWIPPQQISVVAQDIDELLISRIPTEISLLITESLGKSLMNKKEAEKHAQQFMDERKEIEGGWEHLEDISFCEH